MNHTTVIVGANLAGGRAAAGLRSHGYDGRVVLLGDESKPPYERPPLSKEVLWNRTSFEQISLHPEAFYEDQRIELRLSTRVSRLDLARRRVLLEAGEEIAADAVVLATGGTPRKLRVDGHNVAGIFYLRSHEDALALQAGLTAGTRVVVVGMGVIGAEVAVAAARLGCHVVCLEAASTPMSRVFGTAFAEWLRRKHEGQGVRVVVRTGVRRFTSEQGWVTGVEATSGEIYPADLVVVGIGIDPAADLAQDAGISIAPAGILVDEACRTSVDGVFAAGDVAAQACFFSGAPRRIETYHNAQEQGLAAAAAIAGKSVHHCRPCWFWTDQFDLNIQAVGLVDDNHDAVIRGQVESERFTIFFLGNGIVEGVISVNAAQNLAVGRRMVEKRMKVDSALLSDTSIPLKSVLSSRPAHAQAGASGGTKP